MLTISKALSAGQAQSYHAREFASEQQNYWSRERQAYSEWRGAIAEQWGLRGSVRADHFAKLSEGQHPDTGAQLIRYQPAKTYENEYGKEITSVEHRAGWDATFSAPKSVSLTALVGGDFHVREAHRESVRVALEELERYTQTRIGNIHAPETTGKFIAATFEHDTARPVAGYAAPQLHTHAVVFNMTERENGETRALQERSLFQSQRYVTSVYRSELAMRLERLGYEIETGKHGQPEIKGYSKEYLDASSPRREQILAHLIEVGREGAGAAQVAAHRTRDKKKIQSQGEVLRRHRELAAQFGHQADHVVAEARVKNDQSQQPQPERAAQQAATYARNHVFEGMLTVRLDQIMRQRDPELKEAVEQLSRGEVRAAIQNPDLQRRVHEISSREERIGAIAREYARSLEGTLVVSPDNRSRVEINERIYSELQSRGIVKRSEHSITTLVPRLEMTGADRTWAARYEVNDILRYSRSSRETGIGRGEYARVKGIDAEENLLTVTRADGSECTYDPRRQMGVTVYREQEKAFSVGDRIQFTAPDEKLKIANRELGTVQRATEIGLMRVKMDTGREITFDAHRHPHLDHGYAVTSHASQGQTAERVLIHVDTELGAKDLLNHRMAYVSISRGQYNAQIFTDDLGKLSQALSHDVSHQSAYKPEQAVSPMQQKIAPSPAHEVEQGFGLGLGM